MNIIKGKALKAGVGYTIGNICIKGINFLALPFFSRLLTTEEFGIFNLFVSYDAIIYIIIGLAIHSSIKSANYEFKGKIKEYTSSVSLIYIINCIVLFLIIVFCGTRISAWIKLEKIVLYLLILHSFANAILVLYNENISLHYSYKKYLAVSLFNSLSNVLFSLVLITTVFVDEKGMGRIFGATIAISCCAIFALYSFYRDAKPKVEKVYWKFAIKYSLPIVPHGISQILLGQFDIIMIGNMISVAAAGIYSLAGNLKLILTIMTNSIATVWITWFYAEMDKENIYQIKKRSVQLSAFFLILVIGLMSTSRELLLLLGGEQYEIGKWVVIPMIAEAYMLFLYSIIIPSEYYKKKTVYVMLGTIIVALLNVILNYFFIIRFGFIAAAYTTLVSYILYLLLHIFISRKVIGFLVIPLKWLVGLTVLCFFIGSINLLYIDVVAVRWIVGVVVCLIISIILIRDLKRNRT